MKPAVVSAVSGLASLVVLGGTGLAEFAPGAYVVEAEDFAETGDWVVDTQFTHRMGSAYLICPGADRPTARPARTAVSLPSAGTWHVWACGRGGTRRARGRRSGARSTRT